MKIEKIRIENINSLYGIHEIDFTSEEYQKTKLFLMWGDTGSGKTTVLDAITLALFGRSPRIDKVNETANPLMSQGTKKCSSEVTFSVDGLRYRARWSQEYKPRAINKLDGYEREIVRIEPGKLDELIAKGKSNDINKVIENIIHLNYDQFTKTVLLAQGSFEGFLKANNNERANLLEQLTQTNIYTKLSIAAFEKFRKAETDLITARDRLKDIQLLSDDDIQKLHKTKLENLNQINILRQETESIAKQLDWLRTIEKAQTRLIDIQNQKKKLDEEIIFFQPELKRLELAEKAVKIEPFYNNVVNAKKQLQSEQSNLSALNNAIEQAKNDASAADLNVQNTDITLENVKKLIETNKPLFDEIRARQIELNAAQDAFTESDNKRKTAESEYIDVNKKLNDVQNEMAKLETRIQNAGVYFNENAADKDLANEFEIIDNYRKDIIEASDDVAQSRAALETANTKLKKSQIEQNKAETAFQSAKKLKESAIKNAEQAKESYEIARDNHNPDDLEEIKNGLLKQKSDAIIIAKYEEARQLLEDGKPCPLCGATEHPYCFGILHQPSEFDVRINQIEAQLKAIKDAKSALDIAEKTRTDRENGENLCAESLMVCQKLFENAQTVANDKAETFKNYQIRYDDIFVTFNQKIEKYRCHAEKLEETQSICDDLQKRMMKWSKSQTLFDQINNDLKEKANELTSLQATMNSKKELLDSLLEETKRKKQRVEKIQNDITSRFGKRNVEEEERNLKRTEKDADDAHKKALKTQSECAAKLAELLASRKERLQNVDARQNELNGAIQILENGIKSQNFEDENTFLSARLDAKTLKQLKIRADQLENESKDLTSTEKEAVRHLEDTQKEALTSRKFDELSAELNEKKALSDALTKEIGSIDEKLRNQLENETRSGNLKQNADLLEAEYKRWHALNELIGSKTGSKFNQFAQGITFNILLNHANDYLQKRGLLTRYELVRQSADDQSLEFNVFDYLTGKSREARNMSGGEKFCLCLALALGLSQMASKNAKIDSLFIDEGMGTLDDKTLDIALTMLQQLSNEHSGRQIGLITHVARAKEVISTKIIAEKMGGGRSQLKGPGCAFIKYSAPPKPPEKKTRSKKKATSGLLFDD